MSGMIAETGRNRPCHRFLEKNCSFWKEHELRMKRDGITDTQNPCFSLGAANRGQDTQSSCLHGAGSGDMHAPVTLTLREQRQSIAGSVLAWATERDSVLEVKERRNKGKK